MKKNNWIAALLTLCMLVLPVCADNEQNSAQYTALENFTFSRTYPADTFEDVPQSAWYYDNVRTVYELGLMNGKSETAFDPTGKITRAEALAVAARIHSIYHTGSDNFDAYNTTQLSQTTWYGKYVEYIKENDLPSAERIDDDYYTNAETLSDSAALSDYYDRKLYRYELIYILADILPDEVMQEINTVTDDILPDVKVNSSSEYDRWEHFRVYNDEKIHHFYRVGILSGLDYLGTFWGYQNVSRAEAAAVITRMVIPQLRKHIEFDEKNYYKNLYAEKLRRILENHPGEDLHFGTADLNHDGIPELLYHTKEHSYMIDGEWYLFTYENGDIIRKSIINMNADVILYSSDSNDVTSFRANAAFSSMSHGFYMQNYVMSEDNLLERGAELGYAYMDINEGTVVLYPDSYVEPEKKYLITDEETGTTAELTEEEFTQTLEDYPLPDRQIVLYELTMANIDKLFDDTAYENIPFDSDSDFFSIYDETIGRMYNK